MRFARSRSVGAHLGLTPRQYQSGESDRSGRISRCGDNLARTLMYEAAVVILTRLKRASRLKDWALAYRQALRPRQSAHGACPQTVRHPAQHMAVRRAFQLGETGRRRLILSTDPVRCFGAT